MCLCLCLCLWWERWQAAASFVCSWLLLACVCRDAKAVRELDLSLKYAVNTHVHADHITGMRVGLNVMCCDVLMGCGVVWCGVVWCQDLAC